MPPINQVARTRQLYGGLADIFDVRLIMSEVAATTNTKLSAAMGRWAKEMDRQVSQARDKELKQVHKKTAEAAKEAVLSAYRSSGIGTEFPSYRQKAPGKLRRYSGGAMERAMRSKDFITGDERGIRFVDQDILDRTAKQWYRLNFGALPGGSKDPAVGSMRFFGKASSQRAELNGFGPSKAFKVPGGGASGVFGVPGASPGGPVTPTGRGILYITRRGMKFTGKVPPRFIRGVPSKGIEGKRFLDAGARSINAVYPKLLTEMIRGWEAKAKKAMK